MLKTNFTFFSFNHFSRSRRGMKRARLAARKKAGKPVSISQSLLKSTAAVCLAVALQYSAYAQCNQFKNADAANLITPLLPEGTRVASINFADIDGDGDNDCYVSDYATNSMLFYKNAGDAKRPFFQKSNGSGFDPKYTVEPTPYTQFVDIDGDGDLDCFISEYSFGYHYVHITFYENKGTPQSPQFVENSAKNPVGNVREPNFIPFLFIDFDGDGDYDFYYNSHDYYGFNGYQNVVRNTGTVQNPVFAQYYSSKPGETDRTYFDWNKDGLLDYFEWNDLGAVYFRNVGPKLNPKYVPDTASAPNFANRRAPYRFTDLNGDGAPEVFTPDAHYSTIAPVAVIQASVVRSGNKKAVKLSSKNQSTSFTYQWLYNGKELPAATNVYLLTMREGTYTLLVTDSCGTGVSLNYVLKNPSAMSEPAGEKLITAPIASVVQVKAFPNPFANEFTIQLPSSQIKKSTIRITDLAGRVMLSQTTTAGSVKTGNTLQKGMYLLQVWQADIMIYHTTLLKQ